MYARAPGSTSNLGPGFDVLGLALELYVEVTVRESPRLIVETTGEGADLAKDATHLAARVAIDVAGHDRLAITVHSNVPLARGLGSSAAVAVASAAAAGATDPLAVAARVDGHPENAAASVLGGLVTATFVRGVPIARRLSLDPGLFFVALVPDFELSTKAARAVLAQTVSRTDAVFNLGRFGLLVAGLADRRALDPVAGEDRLHQDARTALYPEAPELLAKLTEAGAITACWSGAGPTLLGICDSRAAADAVTTAGKAALDAVGLLGKALCLAPDLTGLVRSP